jgi:hypothetical protein
MSLDCFSKLAGLSRELSPVPFGTLLEPSSLFSTFLIPSQIFSVFHLFPLFYRGIFLLIPCFSDPPSLLSPTPVIFFFRPHQHPVPLNLPHASTMPLNDDIQALIDETEALGWDCPVQLDLLEDTSASRQGFAFLGKLLSLKPPNTHLVRQTLTSAWNFAAPFTIEILSSQKFLFTVPNEAIFNRIMTLGPWNIKNSLLLLKPWPPALAIDEVKLHYCPFWVQVHNLPYQCMTVKNAIKMGKGIGEFMELDNNFSGDLISRQYIRFRVDVNTSKPLVPGYYLKRPGLDDHWIAFKYERLDDYCVVCGLIGHKKGSCPAPPSLVPPGKYDISLKPSSLNGPKLVVKVHSEDSDSGLSSATSVGDSPCGIGPSHMSSSSSKPSTHLVPHVHQPQLSLEQDKLTRTHEQLNISQELALHHVEASDMVLDISDFPLSPAHQRTIPTSKLNPHAATSRPQWKKSSHVQALCQLHDKNQVPTISTISADSTPPYPSLNDPMSYPLLSAYTQRDPPSPFDFSSQDSTVSFLTPNKTNRNTLGFFNQFFSSWAHSSLNPNLLGPPSPFQLNPYPHTEHISQMQPTHTPAPQPSPPSPAGHYGRPQSRRTTFHTHKPSRFMPYTPVRCSQTHPQPLPTH